MARRPARTDKRSGIDSLANYRAKRDFIRTAEPSSATRATTGHGFLVQKHDATRLHYDFRLELYGVLKNLGGDAWPQPQSRG